MELAIRALELATALISLAAAMAGALHSRTQGKRETGGTSSGLSALSALPASQRRQPLAAV